MHKPIEYVIEFYHKSFTNDPEFSIEASTPFQAISVGDYLYLGSWSNSQEQMYGKVLKIRHNIYNIAKEHATHQIGVVFEFAEKDEVHA